MRRDVALLSAAAFCSAASMRATDPLLPLIAAEYAVSTGAAAGAVTAFAFAYALLQAGSAPLGDRYGRFATIAGAAFLSAFCTLACALAPGLDALVVARFVAGATVGAFIPLSLAWIGDTFPYEQRQAVLTRFLVGQILGMAFGTALSGWLAEHFGWRAIFVVLAALLLVIAGLLAGEVRRNAAAAPRRGERPSLAEGLRRLPRVLVRPRVRVLLGTAFFEGFFVWGAFAFIALHFQSRFGAGPGLAGTLLTAFAAGGFAYAMSGRRTIQRLGERRLATFGAIGLAAGYAALAAAPWLTLGVLALALIGGGFYMFHTTVQTHVTHVAPQERGATVAMFATCLFAGQAGGVWIASRAVDWSGAPSVFAGSAIGLALLGWFFRRAVLDAPRAP